MKNTFFSRKESLEMNRFGFFIIAILIPFFSFAQHAITGLVTDESGDPLVGVQIKIKNTTLGTITDLNGIYKISGAQINSKTIIAFSFVGMSTQEIIVGNQSTINVKMVEESVGLNDVVVIGYGRLKKSDLTGAVEAVKMKDLEKAPVMSFDQALAGRIAGVQVTSGDGQPGSEMNIVIRGGNSLTQSNSPLYIVDGFPMEDDMNADINPDDIASIDILKDASATAIYGARAANGVVIIETKKGQIGKPVVSFNASVGYQDILKKMDLMSPYEFVKYQLELNNSDATYRYLNNGKTLDSYKDVNGYDWQSKVFRTAPLQTYNVAIRGGKDDVKYSISGSLSDQKGVIIN